MRTLLEEKKFYAVSIVSVFIIISSIAFYLMHSRYQLELRDIIKENKSLANLLSSLIYEHQKAATNIMESYSQRTLFIDAVKRRSLSQAIPHLQSLNKHHNEIGFPFITDQDGTLWANYPLDRTGFGKNLAYRDWYKGVSKNWKPYVSSVYRMIVLEKGLAVAVSVPIFDKKDKVIGILSGAQQTSFMATFIKENIIDTQKSITLLDQQGNIIFSNDVLYAGEITKYSVAQVMEKAVAGVSADMKIADAKEKGGSSYLSITPIKQLGWSVIVGHEQDEILKSLYGYFILSAVMGIIAFCLFTVTLLLFKRQYRFQKTKELRASEEKYRTLFDEAMDGICLADVETGIIIDCNLAMAALACRKRAELIGRPQTILHPPQDDEAALSPTFKEHRTDKQGQILETLVFTGTGDIREVEIKANILDLQGRKVLQGIFRDITDRKRGEEALSVINQKLIESNRQLETSMELLAEAQAISQLGSWEWEAAKNVIKGSDEFYRLFSVGHDQLQTFQMFLDLLHPDDRERVERDVQDSLINRARYNTEYRVRMPDGDYRDIQARGQVFTDDEGNPFRMVGTCIDITERKRAEDAIKKSEEKYHSLFDNAMEGVYQSTLDGRLITSNMAFCRMIGYESPKEFINAVTDLGSQLYVNPTDRVRAVGLFKEKGYIKNFECQMRRKDGSIFWARFDGRLTKTQDGTPCLEGFIIDITDRKEAEEEIKKLNIELEQRVIDRTTQLEAANKELETFSYSVSHDLRAPLRSIDGFSQVLLEEYQDKLDDTGKADLMRVRKATQKMGFLIDDMLKLSRVTQSEFHRESIALSHMVRANAETHQKNNPDRGVDLTVHEGIIVQGDPYLMQIVIENLIANAWKFTGKEAHPRIEFGATVGDGETIYFIKDNGAGFNMDYVHKLFGAFQRLHKTDEFPGTGIGLATVKRIINRHGGKVWAEGEIGKGATFYFTLP